jgi:hypothetical protein
MVILKKNLNGSKIFPAHIEQLKGKYDSNSIHRARLEPDSREDENIHATFVRRIGWVEICEDKDESVVLLYPPMTKG